MMAHALPFVERFQSLTFGAPLLTEIEDYHAAAKALLERLPAKREDSAIVYMGHGTEHHANAVYALLEYVLHDMGRTDIHIGTVEGYPGFEEVCRALSQRYRMFVVTNGVSHVQRRRLKESGLERYFEGLFISEELGVQKPRRAFFELVSQAVEGFSRERTLVIGDSPTSDVGGAQGFSLDVVWFNPNGRPAPEPAPTREIRALRELLPLLGA